MSYHKGNLEYNPKRDNNTNNLKYLFELQKSFQSSLQTNIPQTKLHIISKYNIELIKNQILALYDEIGEALREVPWKPWKLNQEFNVSKFKMELIDIFHFLINLFLLSGMTSQEVINLFKNKNKINIRRQKNGY